MGGQASNALAVLGNRQPSLRVLLVDDDEDYAEYLRRVLSRFHPMELDVVHDLDSARRALEHRRYALVISDYDLKAGTGIQLLSHARARQANGLRVLISGNTSLVPPTDGEAVHYVWDKQWEPAILKSVAEAALRSAARISDGPERAYDLISP